MRKVCIILLVLALALAGCGMEPENRDPIASTDPAVPIVGDVVVLYTNDIHTYIGGPLNYAVLAAMKASLETHYGQGNVLLVDAGDHIQGTAYGSADRGETIIRLMNAAGYDLATLGNHEFDYGMDRLQELMEAAEYPYISCNFYEETNGVRGETVLPSYQVFDTPGGMTVAFVGITTPESFTKSTPAYFQDEKGNYIYGISGGNQGTELQKDVQTAVDAAGKQADLVIALGHLGDEKASSPFTSGEVIAGVSGIHAFIDGHSHSVVEGESVKDKTGGTVLLTQSGEYLNAVGMMVISGQTGAITTDLIGIREVTETVTDAAGNPVLGENGEPVARVVGYEFESDMYAGEWSADAAVAEIQAQWIGEIDETLGMKVGQTALVLDNYDAEGNRLVRSQETNAGDFTADALYYLFDDMGLDVDVAVMNGGGIRNKGVTGELTYQTAKEIHTFGNVACLQTVTGQQLLDALEWGARSAGTGEECGGFLQVAGITYEIDAAWPSSVQFDDKGVWTGGPTGGYRVSNVQVYNKQTNTYEPLDLTAYYNLAGYNYTLRDMGDGFHMFSGAVNVVDYVMEDYMVLANYIQAFPEGVVTADNSPLLAKYPGMLLNYETTDGSGRIVIVKTH